MKPSFRLSNRSVCARRQTGDACMLNIMFETILHSWCVCCMDSNYSWCLFTVSVFIWVFVLLTSVKPRLILVCETCVTDIWAGHTQSFSLCYLHLTGFALEALWTLTGVCVVAALLTCSSIQTGGTEARTRCNTKQTSWIDKKEYRNAVADIFLGAQSIYKYDLFIARMKYVAYGSQI